MNQDKALAILKSGHNVFLTGAAGTGKTWLLQTYIRYLRTHDIRVAVTASTGIAATHLHGQTIHSWCGMGIRDTIDTNTLKKIYKYRHLRKNIDTTKVLIIDEISMLHQKQFSIVDQILRFFKGVEIPFGGIQVVLCGDFFQLPPVSDEQVTSQHRFSFMSESWVQLKPVICYLTRQYRQRDDRLNVILSAIRNREIDQRTLEQLQQATSATQDNDTLHLYTHNIDVDTVNDNRLVQLHGRVLTYTAEITGKENATESLKRNVMAPFELRLKRYARVMFVKNNPEAGYMNGTLGQVSDFTKKSNKPIITTDDGRTITVEQESWTLENEDGMALATYKQLPLRLAWAISIHKSQGMSLDRAHINLNQAFERGQGYVALSRLRSFAGLRLAGFNAKALEVDSLAYKADLRFRELSQQADTSEENLEERAHEFITRVST